MRGSRHVLRQDLSVVQRARGGVVQLPGEPLFQKVVDVRLEFLGHRFLLDPGTRCLGIDNRGATQVPQNMNRFYQFIIFVCIVVLLIMLMMYASRMPYP
jgi:hypothetical protein